MKKLMLIAVALFLCTLLFGAITQANAFTLDDDVEIVETIPDPPKSEEGDGKYTIPCHDLPGL